MTRLLLLCAVLGATPGPGAAAPASLPIRRFALVAGVNDGGPERTPLRYARSDAERLAQVLGRLGGVAASDAVLLLDVDDAALREAFGRLEARIRAASATNRVELLLYYSGHADEQGLLLRGRRVPYAEVRRWLESSGAQVRIAIVDSCSSGELTRRKGGEMAPPFLVDTSSTVKGHAILTSSAGDEASQESDRIAASFFTHFLITGLRGAADANLDGKVTVSEAYQFAFAETLAGTERTRSGAQHPAYDIQLVGSGDVVVTDLRGTDATLLFPEGASGRFFVRDRDGRLVAELRKVAGRPVALGVEAGVYRVVRDDGDRLAEAKLAIASGERATVPLEGLAPISRERAALRGGTVAYVPFDLSVFPPLSLNGERSALNRVQVGLLGARNTRLDGLGVAPVLWTEEDVTGVQLGALWASSGGPVVGGQLSGIAGLAGSVGGVQLAGVAASSSGGVVGAQASGVGGVAGSVRGVQATGVLGLVRGDAVGLQASGVANWTGGKIVGAQVSGTVNVAGSLEGVQLGLLNVGGEIRGLQLGLVNVSTGAAVRGWQVGLVNVSRRVDGIPLGLVNVVRDGWHRVLVLTDEEGTPTLAYGGGVGLFHTTLEASLRRTASGVRGWASLGPGVHLGHGRFKVDVDLLARRAIEDAPESDFMITLRALGTVSLSPRLALVAGPTLNVLFARDPAAVPPDGGVFGELGGLGDRAWVGLQAGVRL